MSGIIFGLFIGIFLIVAVNADKHSDANDGQLITSDGLDCSTKFHLISRWGAQR